VAIKILPEALASDQQRLQRFIQEAKAASALNHPHILTIHEIGSVGGSRFIATEFIEGETLRQRMNAGMKLADILETAIQTCGALAAAHVAGIVHRDIKPENIMVRRDGYIKVLDFGLAKLTEPKGSTTDTEAATRAMVNTGAGTVMGTANYMSPEQAKGITVDARTDLWSLGAVLYEMITGHAPFAGETPTETISLILQREPAPLTRYVREVPGELERIVNKAVTKDREERYQTAKDMLIDLRSLKRKMEVEAELERTMPLELRGGSSTSSGQSMLATHSGAVAATVPAGATQTVSSAEYIISGIKGHKRVALLVVLFLLIASASLVYFSLGKNSSRAIESIAVLPFVNTTADPNSEYLSDGITESLINSLSQLPNLAVKSRSSVFRYKGRETDPQAAGKDLGVRAVLTGRMVQRGDALSISVELVDAQNNNHLWGQQYNRKLSDVLAVQEDIAKEISDRLRLKLSGEEQKQLTKRYTANTEAYQLYLKGNYYTSKATKDGLRKGFEYFNQAIEKDPNYALAYNGLAYYYIVASEWFLSPKEAMLKTREAAQKALAIDEALADTHTSLATVAYWHDWDWATAEREFKRAIELNPNDTRTHAFYAWYLLSVGRTDQALAEAKRGQELDPISAETNTYLGIALTLAHRYDQAAEQLRKTIDLDSTYWFTHDFLGRALEQQGKLPEAIAEFQRARQLEGAIAELWAMLGHAYALSGQKSEAQKALVELKEPSAGIYVPPYMIATVYAGLGDKDQAFAWLERAYTERSFYLTWLPMDPIWDSLRSDLRFQELLKKIGFPE
ncbi:MAG TPA: protein kinase, partial [Blastocatellia bacterium]